MIVTGAFLALGPRVLWYGVDLGSVVERRRMRSGYAVGDARLSWSGTWLWRPRAGLAGSTIRFQHEPGWGVSAPWPLVSRGADETVYRFDATPADWSNLVAFGPFTPRIIAAPGGNLRVAVLGAGQKNVQGSGSEGYEAKMDRWIRSTVDAVTSIHGRLPMPSTQVLVVPIERGSGPVPWAQVQRGGGTAVHLFVRPEHSIESFVGDWTASHEFSHLFHPYFGGAGRWLAEGLASYYQNVSRARAGQLSELEALKKLHAGFGRGRRDAGLTLRQATRRIREGRYMRVYWSGAAIALIADLELRQRSDGRQSLDTVLADFAACHLPSDRLWKPEEFLARLDQLAGGDLFGDLHRRYIDSERFPDLDGAYAALGLTVDGGVLHVSAVPRASSLRGELLGPVPARFASCPSVPSGAIGS